MAWKWLKLDRSFFKRHDVKIIRQMPNGDSYIVFYLALLAESIDHQGHLRFSDTIPYELSMLATVTDTDVDIAKNAVELFVKIGLMEVLDDDTYFMTKVQTMLGKPWESSAERTRAYRERLRLSENSSDTTEERSKKKEERIKNKEGDVTVTSQPVTEALTADADTVIDYLNTRAGRKFHYTEANRRVIRARLSDGFTVADCQKVIDVKVAEWEGTTFDQYLRPSTLFQPSKFEGYLNQKAPGETDPDVAGW
jgi:uncharacterized phage protein (TIGR02220 family)/predicted phage replisome organizer